MIMDGLVITAYRQTENRIKERKGALAKNGMIKHEDQRKEYTLRPKSPRCS
jgi:hypothetical protein